MPVFFILKVNQPERMVSTTVNVKSLATTSIILLVFTLAISSTKGYSFLSDLHEVARANIMTETAMNFKIFMIKYLVD